MDVIASYNKGVGVATYKLHTPHYFDSTVLATSIVELHHNLPEIKDIRLQFPNTSKNCIRIFTLVNVLAALEDEHCQKLRTWLQFPYTSKNCIRHQLMY